MLEGYPHDDIYLMVEDEFHTIAQTFTQHLHHAEYQRLKKKAREAALPTFHATDDMRIETKRKLEARALRGRQKGAVADVTTVDGVDLRDEDGPDDGGDDDPWLGTSLAGLMADADGLKKEKEKKTALVGLERIQSSTRAARGFGRDVGGDTPAGRKEKMSVFDIFASDGKGRDVASVEEEQERGSEEDGLDHPPRRVKETLARPVSQHNSKQVTYRRTVQSTHAVTTVPEPQSRTREPSIAARRLFDSFDDFDTSNKTSRITKNPQTPPSSRRTNPKQTKARKMQMNDIPTFLV